MADNDAIRGPWMDYNRRYLDREYSTYENQYSIMEVANTRVPQSGSI